MPELPEVETIRLGLEKYIVGRKIKSVDVRLRRIFHGDEKTLVGAKFTKIRRFGKVLVLDLDCGMSLVIHVKMTGQLIYSRSYIPHKHTHVIFQLSDGAKLFYNDIRKFGWLKIVDSSKLMEDSFIKNLGPEPLKGLTLEKFKEILKNKNTSIKALIMDQTKIGGVGNIYANDALFAAGISPASPSSSLSTSKVGALFKALEDVLKKGIKYGGSSENTYVNVRGEKGSYQEHALVYGKTGKPCSKCGTKIQRITIGGRGTFFCSTCQR